MEAILFIGIPGTGKSTFYRERFFRSHVRLNLDMLRTRHREGTLFQACLATRTKFVIDNTNLTKEERARFLEPALAAGYAVDGYFFQSRVADALLRNRGRPPEERVPDAGIHGASGRMVLPTRSEGFRQLFYVWLDEQSHFHCEDYLESP